MHSHLPGQQHGVPGRRLLDIEKLVFATDGQGYLVAPGLPSGLDASRVALRVSAEPQSIAHSVVRAGTNYNLILEPVYAGVIPATALPLGVAILLCTIVSVVVAHWLRVSRHSPLVQLSQVASGTRTAEISKLR
jgi:hypothetical protein